MRPPSGESPAKAPSVSAPSRLIDIGVPMAGPWRSQASRMGVKPWARRVSCHWARLCSSAAASACGAGGSGRYSPRQAVARSGRLGLVTTFTPMPIHNQS
ncbi:MAG: hypothetical protein ACK53Y_15770, partial [bacterium]